MKFTISPEKQNQLREFLSSEIFHNRCDMSYSEYWKEHASRMHLEFGNGFVDISGESGFYVPEKSLTKFSRRLSKALSSPRHAISMGMTLFRRYFDAPRYLGWEAGFNATMSHHAVTDPDLSPHRINHLRLGRDTDGIYRSTEEIRKEHAKWSPYPLSDHGVTAYYFRNLLLPYMGSQRSVNIIEIGGGSGNFASIMYHELSPKMLFMVDLPESIVNSFIFLSSVFPDAQIVLPNALEDFVGKLSKGDAGSENTRAFVFLTPWQINILSSDYFDLSVNTHSFQEMTHAQIGEYFSLVERVSKKDGLFFCVNRVEKIPCKGNAYTEIQQEPPNRFYEYPWRPKNIRLIDEISRLHRVCAADNTAIRLERIVKDVCQS